MCGAAYTAPAEYRMAGNGNGDDSCTGEFPDRTANPGDQRIIFIRPKLQFVSAFYPTDSLCPPV